MFGLVLLTGVLLAYSQSFRSPFTYDDYFDVLDNTSIRRLWPIWEVVHVSGKGFLTRPVTNLTFALDYAVAGPRPLMFHITNLGIHLATAFAFLGVMRRVFILPAFKGRFKVHRSTLALVVALLWALHPLNTEAVSYITQRYESLMALFVLFTFYALLLSQTSPNPRWWECVGVISCMLALGSKEVAVSLPLLLLLFDRAFLAGTFKAAWVHRRGFYLGLLLAWTGFAFVQLHAIPRQFAGFELTTPWWRYALNQPAVILHYLRLSIWPHPLVFDYYWLVSKVWRPLLPGLLVIGSLLIFSIWALVKHPRVGFLPITFLAILAPTSSVMPILDLAVEHRMYLPLMAVILVLVLAVHVVWEWVDHQWSQAKSWFRPLLIGSFAVVLSTFSILTYMRNEDYRDPVDLWRSVIEAVPTNPRAHNNYAFGLIGAGFLSQAINEYAKTVELAPHHAIFQNNYGIALSKIGKYQEALDHLRTAVKLEPTNPKYYNNLGFVLLMKGSVDNAAICFNTALQVDPKDDVACAGLASVMQSKKDNNKAREFVQKALDRNPYNPGYWFQKSQLLIDLGDVPGAKVAFHQAIRFETSAEKIANLAWTMHNRSMDVESVVALRNALELKPGLVQCKIRLIWILATSPDASARNGKEAVILAEQVLKTQSAPSPELLDLLAVALAEAGRFSEARAALTKALSMSKDHQEGWVPILEKKLMLFQQGRPYREGQTNRVDIAPSTIAGT